MTNNNSNAISTTAQITKQNLKDAFWSLYCRTKIDKITVKEVCTLAGYNRSTFYVYFKDIYEILEEIENQVITAEEFRDMILDRLLQAEDKKEILKQLIQLFENKIKYLPILLGENGDPQFRQKLLKRLFPIVISRFRPLTKEEAIEVSYIMEYQSAAVLSTIAKWYTNGKDTSIDSFLDILYSVTTNGIQKELSKFLKTNGNR